MDVSGSHVSPNMSGDELLLELCWSSCIGRGMVWCYEVVEGCVVLHLLRGVPRGIRTEKKKKRTRKVNEGRGFPTEIQTVCFPDVRNGCFIIASICNEWNFMFFTWFENFEWILDCILSDSCPIIWCDLSIYRSIYPSFICLSISYLSIGPPVIYPYLSIISYLPIYPPISYLSLIYLLSVYPSIPYLSIHLLSITYLSIISYISSHLFLIYLSIHLLSIYLFVYQSIYLSIYPSTYVSPISILHTVLLRKPTPDIAQYFCTSWRLNAGATQTCENRGRCRRRFSAPLWRRPVLDPGVNLHVSLSVKATNYYLYFTMFFLFWRTEITMNFKVRTMCKC
jgi:hypothetical protein